MSRDRATTPGERPSHRRARDTIAPPDDDGDTDEITSPVDLLLDDDVKDDDAVERLRRDSRDPYALIYNLSEAVTREKRRNAARVLHAKVAKLVEESDRRAKERKWLLGVVGTVLVIALGALGTGVQLMISKAEREGKNEIRLDRAEQDIQKLLSKGLP
jgi:hypothetical protein